MAENHVFKGANFDKDGNIVREEKPAVEKENKEEKD